MIFTGEFRAVEGEGAGIQQGVLGNIIQAAFCNGPAHCLIEQGRMGQCNVGGAHSAGVQAPG